MKHARKTLGLVILAMTAFALNAVPALAAPELGVTLERDSAAFPTVYHSDERVDLTVKVKNEATALGAPSEGDQLSCVTTTGAGSDWNFDEFIHYSFEFRWMRDGVPLTAWTAPEKVLGGEWEPLKSRTFIGTYTVQAADKERAIQCVVKGTNGAGTGSYVTASQPVTVVNPQPAVAAPIPNSLAISRRPTIAGTAKNSGEKLSCTAPTSNWSIVATAKTVLNSNILTEVFTAKGNGTLSEGSTSVTGVTTTVGRFRVGQTISGSGVTPGTTIVGIGSGTLELSAAATASGSKALSAGVEPFAAGEEIKGNGIPAGTEITGVSGQTLTLSANATASASNVAVLSPASGTWSFEWLRDGQPAAGTVTSVSATKSEYTLTAADVSEPAAPAVFQCLAKATNAGGAALVESSFVRTTAPAPEFMANTEKDFPRTSNSGVPRVESAANTIAGPVTLELALPQGQQTFAFKTEPASWTCDKVAASGSEPARVVCSREDLRRPGEEYPALKVITALGADAPDLATARATVSGGGAALVSKDLSFTIEPALPFGIPDEGFSAALLDEDEATDYTQAGGHPFIGVSELAVNRKRSLGTNVPVNEGGFLESDPIAQVRQVLVDVPRGVAGNQLALPALCADVELVRENVCPHASAVGRVDVQFTRFSAGLPLWAIEPEFGTPAQFAFTDGLGGVYTISARLRPEDGYAVSLELAPAPELKFLESKVTLCDFGPKFSGSSVTGCFKKGELGGNPKPLFTNPTRCGVPLQTRVRLNSWTDPTFIEGPSFDNAQIDGCEAVPFDPIADLQPTNHQADSPTGLDVSLTLPTEGLEKGDECHEKQGDESSPLAAECISESDLREAKVTFPQGMAINPTAGQGLGACSKVQIGLGTNDPISCPESSKIGSVEIETPVLEDTLKGDVYIAKQGEVEGSLIGFYLVFDSPKNGILVKLPARVTPDPQTGQLTVTVAESPEQPFSAVRMHFPGGARATLLMPPKCGTYQIVSELIPWSGGAPVIQKSSFEVNQGPGGGPCPDGGLNAVLAAGSSNPLAGQTSPFNVRLTRPDGSDRFTALGLHMPPGLTAYLKGVPYCPEAAIAQARGREGEGQGQTEIDSPSCPAASRIGTVVAGAGAGDNPLYVDTGRAYLAGPYRGAPLSIVVIAPAVAGPLDLGNVVVRNALEINPRTAEVDVTSDPIPTIKHGVLLDVRDVRVMVDRDRFTLNPTSCEPMSVAAKVYGQGGGSAGLSRPFRVGGCNGLGFKFKLDNRLFGGTHRGDFPRFKAVYKPRSRDANLEDLVLRFPRSEFIEQGHFRTICTRVQYAAGEGFGSQCPQGSVYGHIEASTPLLDEPLSGPVYLRSSDHNLPDVVFALHGQVNAEAAVRIDSVKGGLRASIEDAPDVPLTKVVLNMQGRQKGLFVNSRDICATVNRARIRAKAHNGRILRMRPPLVNPRCRKPQRDRRKATGKSPQRPR